MGTAMMGSGVGTGEDRAEEAAEAAIACPLLEDIDLSGARGILVNITAGLDFAIDEYETIGNAVKAFASENATVVVGTVIDPEMSDEIRVTVVATGIGTERKPDITLVNDTNRPVHKATGTDNLGGSVEQGGQQKLEEEAPAGELEYLDIPAFLRRQAD
jgi:cell division protein FtsZ